MKKKIIGIYDWFNFDLNSTDILGGSETWIVEIAKQFSNHGWHVIVYCNCNYYVLDNIEFCPKWMFDIHKTFYHYDKFITSRGILDDYNELSTDEFDLMLHDNMLGSYFTQDMCDKLDKVFVLSEYHKNIILHDYAYLNGLANKIRYTINGIHLHLYDAVDDSAKTNSMVWSSCYERGLQFFISKVLPKIVEQVPDFHLYVCSYNSYDWQPANSDNVTVLGRLTKSELAVKQMQAKIWCYPNLGYYDDSRGWSFGETFCISAIENAAAHNSIIAGKFSRFDKHIKKLYSVRRIILRT